jgi:hypothetical protein
MGKAHVFIFFTLLHLKYPQNLQLYSYSYSYLKALIDREHACDCIMFNQLKTMLGKYLI